MFCWPRFGQSVLGDECRPLLAPAAIFDGDADAAEAAVLRLPAAAAAVRTAIMIMDSACITERSGRADPAVRLPIPPCRYLPASVSLLLSRRNRVFLEAVLQH